MRSGLRARSYRSLNRTRTPDRKMQCWWLYWIEHVTGDLHQPLHCVSSYEFFPDTGDAGGNRIRVIDPAQPDRPVPLHAYWDAGITHAISKDQAAGLDATTEEISHRWLYDRALRPASSVVSNLKVEDWVRSGADSADKIVYASLKPNDTLTREYAGAQAEFCRKQAVLAGERLARVLISALH